MMNKANKGMTLKEAIKRVKAGSAIYIPADIILDFLYFIKTDHKAGLHSPFLHYKKIDECYKVTYGFRCRTEPQLCHQLYYYDSNGKAMPL